MRSLKVDTDHIAQTSSDIEEQLQALRRIQDALGGEVTGALTQSWQGMARDAFLQSLQGYLEEYTQFIKSCEALNAALKKSGTEYEQAEFSVIDVVRSI